MSIRKKQAEAIIGALMTDLAAAGEFDALARVKQASSDAMGLFKKADPRPDLRKKAWTVESPTANMKDAHRKMSEAAKLINSALITVGWSKSSGSIKNAEDIEIELNKFKKSISAIAKVIGDEFSRINQPRYWKNKAPGFLRKRLSEIKTLSGDLGRSAQDMFSNTIIQSNVELVIERLDDAADEIENALDGLNEPIEADPGEAASTTEPKREQSGTSDAADPAAAFERHIAGGKKELDAFFAKYNIEDNPKAEFFNKARYDIAMAEIISNKDVKSLMSHFKRDLEAKKRLLAHPGFSDAAQRLHEKVTAQIEKASGLLDSLPSLEL